MEKWQMDMGEEKMNKKYCDKCKGEIIMPDYAVLTYYIKDLLIEHEICYKCLSEGIELKLKNKIEKKKGK
jgi:hypothetical protein